MGIAEDLKAVFTEIGTKVSVVGTLPVVSEFVDFEQTDREGFFIATAAADTVMTVGSVLEADKGKQKYLVLFKTDQIFENSLVSAELHCVVCRNTVNITSLSETKDVGTRKITKNWISRGDFSVYITPSLTGNEINMEKDQIYFNDKNKRMWVSSSSGVLKGDRVTANGLFFEVGDIDSLRYPGVSICELFLDVR